MSERDQEPDTTDQADAAAEQAATAVDEARADPEAAERLAEIRRLALAGDLEAPAGAEEIAAALAEAEREVAASRDESLRAKADFQNYQRRAINNEREARELGVRGVVQAVLGVLYHFEMALNLDPETTTPEAMFGGVRVIRDELVRILGGYGVAAIEPAPGDEFDPNEHEAVTHQPAEGVEPGRVSLTLSVGYRLGDRVVRAAKVAVAPGA